MIIFVFIENIWSKIESLGSWSPEFGVLSSAYTSKVAANQHILGQQTNAFYFKWQRGVVIQLKFSWLLLFWPIFKKHPFHPTLAGSKSKYSWIWNSTPAPLQIPPSKLVFRNEQKIRKYILFMCLILAWLPNYMIYEIWPVILLFLIFVVGSN